MFSFNSRHWNVKMFVLRGNGFSFWNANKIIVCHYFLVHKWQQYFRIFQKCSCIYPVIKIFDSKTKRKTVVSGYNSLDRCTRRSIRLLFNSRYWVWKVIKKYFFGRCKNFNISGNTTAFLKNSFRSWKCGWTPSFDFFKPRWDRIVFKIFPKRTSENSSSMEAILPGY